MSEEHANGTEGFEKVFSLSVTSGPGARNQGLRLVSRSDPAPSEGRRPSKAGSPSSIRAVRTGGVHQKMIVDFVALLLDENSDACADVADEMAAVSGDPQYVARALFGPAACLIGERWCNDEFDFMKVTIALSRMQRLFRYLIADFPSHSRADLSRCVLLAPAPGEQHLFGLSIVDDAFRRAGWEVDCCSFDEDAEVLRLAAANHYQIIGMSVGVDRHLPDVTQAVERLRSRSLNRSVFVIGGGSMITRSPEMAAAAGFDMLAVDAQTAVGIAEAVISGQSLHRELHMAGG